MWTPRTCFACLLTGVHALCLGMLGACAATPVAASEEGSKVELWPLDLRLSGDPNAYLAYLEGILATGLSGRELTAFRLSFADSPTDFVARLRHVAGADPDASHFTVEDLLAAEAQKQRRAPADVHASMRKLLSHWLPKALRQAVEQTWGKREAIPFLLLPLAGGTPVGPHEEQEELRALLRFYHPDASPIAQ